MLQNGMVKVAHCNIKHTQFAEKANHNKRIKFDHVCSIEKLDNLKIPKSSIKSLMKSLHQNAIKYLTYLVLNKRKFDNKQNIVTPP